MQLTINGILIEAQEGSTVLQAAHAAGIFIPTLCNHPNLPPSGGCRLCMVEVEGMRLPIASCTLPASAGMVVRTDTPKLRASRQFILTMLFSERNHFCPFCLVSGGGDEGKSDCELQKAAYFEGMDHWSFQPNWNSFTVDASHPFYVLDNNRCILCRRCVSACSELIGNHTLSLAERGSKTMLVADLGTPWGESTCVSCGSCVQVCPTGALMDRHSAYQGQRNQMQTTSTVCTGCSVGCGIQVLTRDNRLVRIEGDWEASPNHGILCTVGRNTPLNEKRTRLTSPMLRQAGSLQPCTWEQAISEIASRLEVPEMDQGQRVAALASTRLTAETLDLFRQIFSDHLKSEMVTSIEEGMPTALVSQFADHSGAALEARLDSLEQSDCVFIIGANLAESHQVAGFLVKRNLQKGTRLILMDPASNPLDDLADCIIKPAAGQDGPILLNLVKLLESDTSGDLNSAITQAAELLKLAIHPVFLIGKGLTMNGSLETLQAIHSLANELQKTRQVGIISMKGEANSLVAAQYRLDRVYDPRGYKVIFIALGDDYPSQRLIERVAGESIVIVQASYASRLTDLADVVLPVETWAEQEGHFVNLEGRIKKSNPALKAPQGVRSSQSVLLMLAEQMGFVWNDLWKQSLVSRTSSTHIGEEELALA